MTVPLIIRELGRVDYLKAWRNMQDFTEKRDENTPDEMWVLEHNPVFTLGLAGKEEHILKKPADIPIIRTDRGGQITYHAPGQVVIYTLINLKRANLSIRELVENLEIGIINYLATLGIAANGDRKAPGVYVTGKKIASLGLKVRKGCTYHGISFNLNMDLRPFSYINVCGYSNLQVVQLNDLIHVADNNKVGRDLANHLAIAVYTNRTLKLE